MKHGMGRDIWTLTETQIVNVVKVDTPETSLDSSCKWLTRSQWTWVTQITYIPAINLTKVAILLFFINVFPVQKFQWVCWGTIVHCALFMISTFIASILACIPVEYAWVNWKGEGNGLCYENNAFWWAVAVRLAWLSGQYWKMFLTTFKSGHQHRYGRLHPCIADSTDRTPSTFAEAENLPRPDV